MNRYRCVEVYYAGQIDRAEMKPDEAGAYVLYEDHARSLAEAEKRFEAAQSRANHVSGLHGEKFDLVCELFRRVQSGLPLTSEEVKAWDLRIYGPGRPVPPHRSGQ